MPIDAKSLKPDVRILVVSDNYVVLGWLGQRILIRTPMARALPKVLEDLRHPQTIDALLGKHAPEWSPQNLRALIDALEKRKLMIGDAGNQIADAITDEYWQPYRHIFSSSRKDWESAQKKMSKLKVTLITRWRTPNDFLSELDLDVQTPGRCKARSDGEEGLFVLLGSSTDLALLENMNEFIIESRELCLPVLLDLHGAIVGPLIGGTGRPCLSCFSKRIRAGLSRSEIVFQCPTEHFDDVIKAWPRTSWRKLDAILLDEIFKVVSEIVYSPLQGGAYRFDFLNQRSEYEDVFPVPGCLCQARIRANEG